MNVKRTGRPGRLLRSLLLPWALLAWGGPASGDDWFAKVEASQPFESFGGLQLDPEIPSPRSFLGHAIGERFTRHAAVLDYLEAVASRSDRVTFHDYGRTHERRRLVYQVITSPENHARLDEILARNRELADPRFADDARIRETIESSPVIVWLSYNVHGNEASASEAGIRVVYTMAAGRNAEIADILDRVVLVVDPMLNPDGRERYVQWYGMVRGTRPDPAPESVEHDEPWPGGRTNHYLFDLNRDWLWLVQPESRQRIAAYRRFLPQLHIDYHEQGYRSPYFFGSGDEPYNRNIPEETKRWIERYGRANAEVFDREGLLYSTRERFDYLYPGYGKVMPVYYGAVGMLCEKGGHGRAGLTIEVTDQHALTLRERARHHFLTSMSYLETSAANRAGQLERFRRFFTGSMEPPEHGPRAFLLHAGNDPALLERVYDLCRSHGIEIERVTETEEVRGLREYRTGGDAGKVTVAAGSWLIRAAQPMGRLVRTLFERETEISSIETYDITGWSVPLVFGLRAHFTNDSLELATEPLASWQAPAARSTGEGGVALLVDAASHRFPRAAGVILRHEAYARRAAEAFEIDGHHFAAGSLILHEKMNRERDLDALAVDLLEAGVSLHRAASGLTEHGPVLGADANRRFVLPRIAVVRGRPMSSYNFGEIWHMLDVEYGIPHSVIDATTAARPDPARHNMIVLPDARGSLDAAFTADGVDRLQEFVRDGGVVVAVGGSASWASRSLLGLEGDGARNELEERLAPAELDYDARRDRALEDRIPGTILRAAVDTGHPLAAGVPDWVAVLKRGARTLPYADRGYVVARFDEDGRLGGLASPRSQERLAGTPFLTQHALGSGQVLCFSDGATTRGFTHATMRLLLNAILFGPSL